MASSMAPGGPVTFYWHDYETAGLDTRRDSPTQFAGIRTDAELREIGEPLMLFCRPPRDALPDPQSCLVTGVTPQECEHRGVPEAEFARRILDEMAAPGTISLGYNSLRFDDEVTRHLLWRNLVDPYAREWQNGCGRWDLLNVVSCVYALRPEALSWPRHPDGRHSLKLEHLSAANGLAHEDAHDALSDVRATIALARLIRQRVPRLWDYCLSMRSKQEVQKVVQRFGAAREPFLHVSSRYPQERGHLAVVWPLAPHPTQTNEVIVWDLAHDPLELLELSADALHARLFTPVADLPAGVTRLPVKTVRVNQCPVVVQALRTLRPDRAAELGIDLALQQAHADRALARAAEFDALDWSAVFQREWPSEEFDAEQTLYTGPFLSADDRRTLNRAPLHDAAALAAWQPRFEDPRLPDLLLRYRARNWPHTLSPEESALWERHRADRLHRGKGGFRTLQQYADAIDALAEQVDEPRQALLEALVDWAEVVAP